MAQSNHERVSRALDLLNQGLRPYVEREMHAVFKERWLEEAQAGLRTEAIPNVNKSMPNWDTQALLIVMGQQWNAVFNRKLSHAERSLISELREIRNSWAHQKSFSTDDTYRALDSVHRLLTAIAAQEANEVEQQKYEILRVRFEEQLRRETKKVAVAPLEGQPAGGLKPWREVVTPHPDVASGRYQQAEFAADLGQVHRGEGADEYRIPRDFFQRTFLTDGLKHLLSGALQRLSGKGGDPVIELQTNFGGGKTHSMLALYHLFSGEKAADLLGIEPVLEAAGVSRLPKAQVAVLVGTALSPGQPHKKPDGTVIHTLWGELAWQLLGKEGYTLVANADRQGVSPGSDVLREIFATATPCLILIDEWVAFVRQLYDVSGLPAGSFDANISFAQSLTEAVKATPQTLVVASIPASDIEIGGIGGQEALSRLKNTFGRLESSWRPASAEESFEIVRRRLFQPLTERAQFVARDAVARAFADFYRTQPQEFPSACREGDYERRLKAAYPVHPELFDRLYNDWSTLDKFQRTRGTLRLMAAAIHALWTRQDAGILIMPASIPVDEPPVQVELTRYLEDSWGPVIDKDVDGAQSLPLALDKENPNLGRYSACRRVARTLYLGSAPTQKAANKGLDDRQIKLGCVQPGESTATFGDALRRLTDQATYLYVDGKRYWYATQPSVTRLAQDRAAQQDQADVWENIKKRLQQEQLSRGDFARVHACPASSGDVPDEREVRLVILGPEAPHTARVQDSEARKQARALFENRGTSPRIYRNTLVFLAPDKTRLNELEQAVRQYLAWDSIEKEKEALNLDPYQASQTRTKCKQADDTVKQRIPETFYWLLVPGQADPNASIEWEELRLQGPDALAVRAGKKLRNDELLLPHFGATRLRMELDNIPLWRGDHVGVKQLVDDFAQYLYLPRVKDASVLQVAVQEGVGRLIWEQETFAYAEGFDETRGRYVGLRAGTVGTILLQGPSVLVKPEVAARQLELDAHQQREAESARSGAAQIPGTLSADRRGSPADSGRTAPGQTAPAPKQVRRYHGSVSLDPTRLGRDAGQIAEAVVQHLAGLVGAQLEITLEIQARLPEGVPDTVVRTVSENARTLKFTDTGFESE